MTGTKKLIEDSGRKIGEVTHLNEVPLRSWIPVASGDRYSDQAVKPAEVNVTDFLHVRKAEMAEGEDTPVIGPRSVLVAPRLPGSQPGPQAPSVRRIQSTRVVKSRPGAQRR